MPEVRLLQSARGGRRREPFALTVELQRHAVMFEAAKDARKATAAEGLISGFGGLSFDTAELLDGDQRIVFGNVSEVVVTLLLGLRPPAQAHHLPLPAITSKRAQLGAQFSHIGLGHCVRERRCRVGIAGLGQRLAHLVTEPFVMHCGLVRELHACAGQLAAAVGGAGCSGRHELARLHSQIGDAQLLEVGRYRLSIGDEARLFDRQMSPWACLLDWLAFRYSILFIVSAGNDMRALSLNTPSHALEALTPEQRSALAFTAMTTEHVERRLLAPAEALNVWTVGALHADQATAPVVPGRYDLFAAGGLSPLSRIGHGFRRAIKPDILMPGGRVLYRARMQPDPAFSVLDVVTAGVAPGHRVAVPPLPGETLAATAYSRGTSNAAALASRAAAQAYDRVELLRAEGDGAPDQIYDAVLLKALLVHGAQWGDWPDRLLAEHPELEAIAGVAKHAVQKDLVTRWLGYGPVDVERAITCAAERATLLGVGGLGADEAFVFSAPLRCRRHWRARSHGVA